MELMLQKAYRIGRARSEAPLIAIDGLARIFTDVYTRILRREAALSKTAVTFQCNPHCSPPSWGSPSPTLAPSNDDRTSIILCGRDAVNPQVFVTSGRSPRHASDYSSWCNASRSRASLMMGTLQNHRNIFSISFFSSSEFPMVALSV